MERMERMEKMEKMERRSKINVAPVIQPGKLVQVWHGSRRELMDIVRGMDKNTYERFRSDEITYSAGAVPHESESCLPHGSYNLFHRSSNKFHLIHEGDYTDPEFIEAIIAYCTVENILVPRAMGGGRAPPIARRIPIIILDTSDTDYKDLTPYIHKVTLVLR